MGHRLSKIYTRTGDQGQTGLGDGQRVAKDDVRVEAYGTIDELNSLLGLLLCENLETPIATLLSRIQHHLFDLGGELSIPGLNTLEAHLVSQLEQQLDQLNEQLPALKEFILPGGGRAASLCHVARTVCRRAERQMVSLNRQQPVNIYSLQYINRLSDFLFVLARHLARNSGHGEVLWQHERVNKPSQT